MNHSSGRLFRSLLGIVIAAAAASPVHAQISDVSDGFWSIVVPSAAAVDVDMGTAQVGTTRDSLVTAFLNNSGAVDVRIDSIYFAGPGAGVFRLASGIPPFEIPRGESRGVEFRFTPSAAAVYTAEVVIHTQADTLRRAIRGEGVQPRISVEAQLVDFGQVKVNGRKDTSIALLVRNIGSGPLPVSVVQQLGPDLDQFGIVSGGGAFTLAAGEGRAMQLRFSPLRPGRTSGRLGFHHGGAGSPAVVELFGEGVLSQIAVEAQLVDFGQVKVNAAKDTSIAVVVRNVGSGILSVSGVQQLGPDLDQFGIVSGGGAFTLAAGEGRAMQLRFSPLRPGRTSGRLGFHHGGAGSPAVVELFGEGVLSQIAVEAQLVDFGQVKVNAAKDTSIAVVVRNVGSGILSVSGVQQLGPDLDQFGIVSGGGAFTLAAGEGRAMQLRFSPLRPGRTSGRLGFHHGGAGSPAVVELFGEGVGVQGAATLHVDTIRARPGELVDVPIYLRNAVDLELTGATGFNTELRYDASLLSPTGGTPNGIVTNGERRLPLDNIPVQADSRGVLATLHFVATLGTAEGTPLRLENTYASGGKVAMSESPGYFLLTDLCREGGARLFEATGTAGLAQNRPNPFNSETVIEFETIEDAPARLSVQDLAGRTVAVLLDGRRPPGRYAVSFNASSLASGSYFCVLETGARSYVRLMEVVK